MNRHFIFNNYWWISVLFGGILVFLAFCYGGEDRSVLIAGIVASTLSFCYFVLQQKLAEASLFYELFKDFNLRYDEMNGRLIAMVDGGIDITPGQKQLIVDYFNLCAEEYFFYKSGYIPKNVWQSWCRGMAWYLKRHPYRDVWNQEVKTESFYGLTETVIREGSA